VDKYRSVASHDVVGVGPASSFEAKPTLLSVLLPVNPPPTTLDYLLTVVGLDIIRDISLGARQRP